jgi:hypothetical protein
MWKGGFQVNDGEFRSLTDKENAPFLKALAAGQVPPELMPPDVSITYLFFGIVCHLGS